MKERKPFDWHEQPPQSVCEGWEGVIAFVLCVLIVFGVPAP